MTFDPVNRTSLRASLLCVAMMPLGCGAGAVSTAPMTPAVTLEQGPAGGNSFDFCSEPASPVNLTNAAWLSFLSANEYAHAAVFAPILNDLGFHNPNEPGDLAWPDCLADLRSLRAAEQKRSPELVGALGSDRLRPMARGLVPAGAPWGSCVRPFLEAASLRTDALPAASFQHHLVREAHPGSFLQFFSAGEIQSGGKTFRDASTQVAFARHRDRPLVLLVFRGTEPSQMADVATDLKTWKTPLSEHGWPAEWGSVHAGFLEAFESVEPLLLQKLNEVTERGDKIWVTGHSLGGGLATLMAARLLRARDEGASIDLAGMYTFGSPRVGDKAFAARFRGAAERHGAHVVRVRNENDVVTSIPGLMLEFEHVGTLAYLKEGAISVAPREDPPYGVLSVADHGVSGLAPDGTETSGYYRRIQALRKSGRFPDLDRCKE